MQRKPRFFILFWSLFILFGSLNHCFAINYFFHPQMGSDNNNGLSSQAPFKTLKKANAIDLKAGDRLLLAVGHTFHESFYFENLNGTEDKPIIISSYNRKAIRGDNIMATIDAKHETNGITLLNCSHIIIENINITADGGKMDSTKKMRCGILVSITSPDTQTGIICRNLTINDIFYNKKGFQRGEKEVTTANGTQSYGWGIRFIVSHKDAILKNVIVSNCTLKNIAHTGIKFTANSGKIDSIELCNNQIVETGGPGIQMSGVQDGHIYNNSISYSGCDNDSRKWGRGSGLWTWSCSNILIEKNRFTNANGPGDSAGCHIDFNCKNIIVQYNFSANNAGGFCEILGNTYNCAYRYNISVNDGFREKGVNGSFQEGKILWLSGYCIGERRGPYNSYFYNNTIYTKSNKEAKIAIDRVANGILIANNIFHIEGESITVKGDQYNPETEGEWMVNDFFFKNNLFLSRSSWPSEQRLQDEQPFFGNAGFRNAGGIKLEDYLPKIVYLSRTKVLQFRFWQTILWGFLRDYSWKRIF